MYKPILCLFSVMLFSCAPKQLTNQRYWNHSSDVINYIEFDSDTSFVFSYQNGSIQGSKKGVYIKEGQNYILNTLPDSTNKQNQFYLKNTSASVKGNKLVLENFIGGQNHTEVFKRTKKKYSF